MWSDNDSHFWKSTEPIIWLGLCWYEVLQRQVLTPKKMTRPRPGCQYSWFCHRSKTSLYGTWRRVCWMVDELCTEWSFLVPLQDAKVFGWAAVHNMHLFWRWKIKWHRLPLRTHWHAYSSPNPVVGSSTNSKTGLVNSSAANDSRFFSPPDMVFPFIVSPIRVWQQSNRLTFDNVDFTNALFSWRPIRLSSLRLAWKCTVNLHLRDWFAKYFRLQWMLNAPTRWACHQINRPDARNHSSDV